MAAIGQLEVPIATVKLQLEMDDTTIGENFLVKKNLTSTLFSHFCLQRNSTLLDMSQGILIFPIFPCNLNLKIAEIQIRLIQS